MHDAACYCPRCDDRVRALRPWRGWRPAWHAWKVGFAVVLCISPILASDYCVMLPSTMMYLVAGSILRSHARLKPVCSRCSLELDDAPAGTAIRPRATVS
ncbi:MAG: hypothetical protein AB7S26_06935 [Sandaracinaceae bacterium]